MKSIGWYMLLERFIAELLYYGRKWSLFVCLFVAVGSLNFACSVRDIHKFQCQLKEKIVSLNADCDCAQYLEMNFLNYSAKDPTVSVSLLINKIYRLNTEVEFNKEDTTWYRIYTCPGPHILEFFVDEKGNGQAFSIDVANRPIFVTVEYKNKTKSNTTGDFSLVVHDKRPAPLDY